MVELSELPLDSVGQGPGHELLHERVALLARDEAVESAESAPELDFSSAWTELAVVFLVCSLLEGHLKAAVEAGLLTNAGFRSALNVLAPVILLLGSSLPVKEATLDQHEQRRQDSIAKAVLSSRFLLRQRVLLAQDVVSRLARRVVIAAAGD